MKTINIIFIILSSFFIFSCANDSSNNDSSTKNTNATTSETSSIPRANWDKDNIAYTNIGTAENGRYVRKSGVSGIIGYYEYNQTKYVGMGQAVYTDTYTFSESGYYTKSNKGYANMKTSYNTTDSGTFIIYSSSKTTDYYVLKTTSSEGHGYNWYFYQVSNDKFDLQPYIIVNGSSVYPDGYTGIQ